MNFKRFFLFIYVFFQIVVLTVAACSGKSLKTAELLIQRRGLDPLNIITELAFTDEEHQKGLMYRRHLADGKGMLFIFDRDKQLSFWMKNTYIPLSIAYISSDGRIIDIKDMNPHDLSTVKSSRSVRYALEVPQGWFARNSVVPGDIVVLDKLLK